MICWHLSAAHSEGWGAVDTVGIVTWKLKGEPITPVAWLLVKSLSDRGIGGPILSLGLCPLLNMKRRPVSDSFLHPKVVSF